MNLLIIEDDPAIRETLRDLLELNGHTVALAATGEQGVRLAESGPDLIICDIGLPGMDGYTVLQAVQRLPHGREVPFIFLTARADRLDQRKGMALGADDYVTKPFTEREILDAVAARVGRLRPLRGRIEQLLAERRIAARADWSHELLTPLNGVLGGLELIESEIETIPRDELRELLGLIRAGAERQRLLAGKLISYFSLQQELTAGRAERTESCLAHQVVDQIAHSTADAAKRTADVTVTCEPGVALIDGPRLGEAVGELTDNALRFSRPGQPVAVTGRIEHGRYRVEVLDEGPGMTAEERGQIAPFMRFPRGNIDRPGLGLGLAIVQSIAALTGAELALAARSPGAGLAATLTLPGEGQA